MPVTVVAAATRNSEAAGRSHPKSLLPREDNDMTDIFKKSIILTI